MNSISDLTLALVIVSTMMVSCQSATLHHPGAGTTVHGMSESYTEGEDAGTSLAVQQQQTTTKPKRGNQFLRKWNIRPIQIQLDIAIAKYRAFSRKADIIYIGPRGCGVDGCHNFRDFLSVPDYKANATIFKNRKRHFGKKIFELLEKFYVGLEKIEKSFCTVLHYEDKSGFWNQIRENLLQDLKKDIIMVKTEVEMALEVKNPVYSDLTDEFMRQVYPPPTNQTELLIEEWYIIERSKGFLVEWKKILKDLEAESRKVQAEARRKRLRKRAKLREKSKKKVELRKKKGNRKPKKS